MLAHTIYLILRYKVVRLNISPLLIRYLATFDLILASVRYKIAMCIYMTTYTQIQWLV